MGTENETCRMTERHAIVEKISLIAYHKVYIL